MKKKLSALLSFCMAACVCTVFPFSASAASDSVSAGGSASLVMSASQVSYASVKPAAAVSAKDYMSQMKNDLQTNVPGNVKQGDSGKTDKIQYFSKKANRNKPANVWTPPGYDPSKKYPVMFMHHGVMGGENDMLSGWSIREMASNLIKSGEAEPFIIVFPQMYTDPNSGSAMGISMDVMDRYDDYVYDLTESLYPYICEHYSVATGRENTAIAGFSMGGRESLYVGLMCPDKFGYVCASSPAPGIVPASDMFISNHLGSKKLNSNDRMKESDFKFSDSDLPYILLIGGGTNDQVVGTFPKQYHELFDKNGTMNLWMEFPGAGHDASVGTPLFYNFFRYVFKAEASSTVPVDQPGDLRGDVNGDKTVDKKDVEKLRDYLLGKTSDIDGKAADLDSNNTLTGADLSALKAIVMKDSSGGGQTTTTASQQNPPEQTTSSSQQNPWGDFPWGDNPWGQTTQQTSSTSTTTTASSAGTQSTGTQPSGSHSSAKEYMSKMKNDLQTNVPGNVKQGDSGKTDKIQYFSKKANRNKPANVWTPPGYDPSKKYPVMFMHHGVMGGENDMLSGWSIREMASNLIKSGEAEPFIIVFPQMYTDPNSGSAMGISMDVMDRYDDYVYDLTESLYPYICEHYSVATGRENTAIAGFSMGGRESLYVGLMCPDMFGYVCASSPAPGIVPASDMFISNHLGSKKLNSNDRMKESDFKFSDSDLPYILLIGGGTNDQVVGTFPKQYHELFDKNGTMNLWMEFPGAGHDASVGTPLFYNFFRYVFKA